MTNNPIRRMIAGMSEKSSVFENGVEDWIEDEDEIEYGPPPGAIPTSGTGGNGSKPRMVWDEASIGAPAGESQPIPKLSPIRFIEGEVLPPREWIVPDWLPTRKVALLQGDGGDGKTPLMQQLQSSCATALPWIGLLVEECVSVGFYTEDEEQDIKERQAAIDVAYNQHCPSANTRMHLFPRCGEDNELVVFDRAGVAKETMFYRQVRETVLDVRARLLVLDVAVDLYGGDEINRRQVRAFMQRLGALAREMNGSVVMTGHLSQAGIRSDGGHSGSTDWSNASRVRFYLARPKPDGLDEKADPDARILTRKKANLARIGDTVKLRWQNGLLIPDGSSAGLGYPRRSCEDVFLAILDQHSSLNMRPVSDNPHSRNYAPKVFGDLPDKEREEYRQADFKRAMNTLFKSRQIKNITYGRPGRWFERIMHVRETDDGKSSVSSRPRPQDTAALIASQDR